MSENDFVKPHRLHGLQWFYLESYIHVSIKKNHLLLYNPYSGKFLEYENDSIISKFVKRLESLRNLRVILLKHKELTNPDICKFIGEVRAHFMGDLLNVEFSAGKPVSMPPIVKIQKDIKYLNRDSVRSLGEKIMNYLSEMTLHITDECSEQCSTCNSSFRQFLCCGIGKKKHGELKLEKIIAFLDELKGVSSLHLNIVGGNILEYSELERLLEYLTHWDGPLTFTIHYLNLGSLDREKKNDRFMNDRMECFKSMNEKRKQKDKVTINIPITFPLDEEKLSIAMERVRAIGLDYHFSFIIEESAHIELSNRILSNYPVEEPVMQAFYNGKNLKFFKENLYIDRAGIENARPSLKDIYRNQSVNVLFWGRLTVLPNGKVYANVNENFLGFIGKDSVYDILMKEMKEGRSWRRIRKNMKPCRSCVFEALCPPISNYVNAIGKANLCHIR